MHQLVVMEPGHFSVVPPPLDSETGYSQVNLRLLKGPETEFSENVATLLQLLPVDRYYYKGFCCKFTSLKLNQSVYSVFE